MSGGQSRIELLQGTLDFIILQTLRWGPQHGFAVAQIIRAHSSGTLQVDTGSLYPALHRLERAKLIEAEWGRSDKGQRVRVYRLTAAGRFAVGPFRGRAVSSRGVLGDASWRTGANAATPFGTTRDLIIGPDTLRAGAY